MSKKTRENFLTKNYTQMRGITLIALVITLIVLLILAGVSIATLTGDNGILNQAQRAKEETEIATDEEQRKLAIAEATMNFEETEYQGIKIPAGMAPTRIEGESKVEEGLVAVDKNGNEWVWIAVPESTMSEVDVNFEDETGYSEKDKTICNTLTEKLKQYASPYTQGSNLYSHEYKDEWYADARTDGSSNIVTEDTAELTLEQKELDNGCGLTLREYKETYQRMIKSIYKNKGFWIGRYEAGIEGSRGTDEASLALGRTKESEKIDISKSPKAICQKDTIPYNYVYYYEAQKLASQMAPDETKTSSLMFGIQWDLVCKYLEGKDNLEQADINSDSGSWGNYLDQAIEINSKNAKQYSTTSNKWSSITGNKPANQSILLSTGASNKTKKLNIYDLAGNQFEYTLAHCLYKEDLVESPCLARGGYFNESGYGWAVSSMGPDKVTKCSWTSTFRPALY